MKEPVFNFFYFVEEGIINEFGFVVHFVEGTDEEKLLWVAMITPAEKSILPRMRLRETPIDFLG